MLCLLRYIEVIKFYFSLLLDIYPESRIIDLFDIIASRVGERLLVMSHENDQTYYELRDPYLLAKPVAANKLFEVGSFKFQRPCIVTFDEVDKVDKVIGVINKSLLIKKLINGDWIKYLRGRDE